nr:unnamed protein product [Callosobruchus analis]
MPVFAYSITEMRTTRYIATQFQGRNFLKLTKDLDGQWKR